MTHAVKAVLFDVGHTLLWPDMNRIAAEVIDETRIAPQQISPAVLWRGEPGARRKLNEYMKQKGYSLADTEQNLALGSFIRYYSAMLRHGFELTPKHPLANISSAWLEDAAKCLWQAYRQENLFSVVGHDVLPALERLHGKYRLGVISNAEGTVAHDLARLGLINFFDVVIDSGVVRKVKPDPHIFSDACIRLGINQKQAVYVGDMPYADMHGASDAGILPIHYDPLGVFERQDLPVGTPICRNLLDVADWLHEPTVA